MADKPEDTNSTYDVFVSYSRDDAAFVNKLVYRLGRYAPPKSLELPTRCLSVFVDNKDLVGTEYYQAIEEVLNDAKKLIVVCSPSSRKSRYVEDEIRRFLKVDERSFADVIPILLRGIPNNEAKPEEEEFKAFPDVLYEHAKMPLAVNYLDFAARSKVHRGKHADSWFTLLANILEVDRDELEERELKRRLQRRLMLSAITAVVTCIILAALAIAYVNQQRHFREETNRMVSTLTTTLVADDLKEAELEEQFSKLLAEMREREDAIVEALHDRREVYQPAEDDEDDTFAKQRAHAAIVLVFFHEFDLAVDYLDLDNAPESFAQFAARCRKPGGLKPQQLIEFAQYLINKSYSSDDTGLALAAYGALLGVGEYPDLSLTTEFIDQLKEWYCERPEAAIHSACAWLLGRDVAAQLNERLALPLENVRLDQSDKEWFVVKLPPEAGDANGNQYITFVIFKDGQRVFAIADREATVGICEQLRPSDLKQTQFYQYQGEPQKVDPANKVKFDHARRLCHEFSKHLPKTLQARLPYPSEWASAWGRDESDRRFQFGRDVKLLKRYAECGPRRISRPVPGASHRPSTTGMFDIHGNVAEWIDHSDALSKRMHGGAVGQAETMCEWNPDGARFPLHFGFRFCITWMPEDQPSP